MSAPARARTVAQLLLRPRSEVFALDLQARDLVVVTDPEGVPAVFQITGPCPTRATPSAR